MNSELEAGNKYIHKQNGIITTINRVFRKGRGFTVVHVMNNRNGRGLMSSRTRFLNEFKLFEKNKQDEGK